MAAASSSPGVACDEEQSACYGIRARPQEMDECGQVGVRRPRSPEMDASSYRLPSTRTINYHVCPSAAYRSTAERGPDDKETK